MQCISSFFLILWCSIFLNIFLHKYYILGQLPTSCKQNIIFVYNLGFLKKKNQFWLILHVNSTCWKMLKVKKKGFNLVIWYMTIQKNQARFKALLTDNYSWDISHFLEQNNDLSIQLKRSFQASNFFLWDYK